MRNRILRKGSSRNRNAIATVAFIGLGAMGVPMVANLEKAGFRVRTYDVNGKGNCASGREAAEGAQVLVTMLPNGAIVREAVLQALPGLARGAIVLDMSSSDPAGTRELSRRLARRGIELVDAPVSGAVIGARNATLAIMVGGSPRAFERVRPVLEAMGRQIFHVGPTGAGHAVKALNNYLGAVGTIAGFEALLIARKFGLDPEPMLAAINASTGRNSTTERKIPRDILPGTFASGFRLALMAKDVGIAAGLAKGLGLKTPFLATTLRTWKAAQRALPADADHVEIYKVQEALALGRAMGQEARRKARSGRRSTRRAPSRGRKLPSRAAAARRSPARRRLRLST